MDASVLRTKDNAPSISVGPSLIERIWPAQKLSVEAQRERKAVAGQTLTGLGGYWKGRKPLVLVRACVLGALLPSTGDDERDLRVFEILMGLDEEQILDRLKKAISVEDVLAYGTSAQINALLEKEEGDEGGETYSFKKLPRDVRFATMAQIVARMPYVERAARLLRPEEVPEDVLTGRHIPFVNEALGLNAKSLTDVVEALGVERFGRRPKVGDAFAGGGSIPFESARIGCEAYGSDLNPIAAMLTWSSLNVVGSGSQETDSLDKELRTILRKVEDEFDALGFERDEQGNRAKAFLYCLEVRCPKSGWLVPLLPTRVISPKQKAIVELTPNHAEMRFELQVRSGVSDKDLTAAEDGTFDDQKVIYDLDGERYTIPLRTIRGDKPGPNGETVNGLRMWDRTDVAPREADILHERLYCIQWLRAETLRSSRPEAFYKTPTADDLAREDRVRDYVTANLLKWMEQGIVADMRIEPGEKTDEPIRTRGWTYWHHLFHPRQIALIAHIQKHIRSHQQAAQLMFFLPRMLDNNSRLCRWKPSQGSGLGSPVNTFDNMALNPLLNYAVRGTIGNRSLVGGIDGCGPFVAPAVVEVRAAKDVQDEQDIWITDPPYADAVCYHEITEFFIAWMRKGLPEPFSTWVWDSRRPLAVKGKGDDFRKGMVEAYSAMSAKMPDNGVHVVMFTHQDAAVWADMAQIFWGSGLQVMAAWYIATETTSELKKGGYVQGTVILVLRKRKAAEAGFKDEIVQEVKSEVAEQIDTMSGLNQRLKGQGRIENLFEDADLQMAGYAAALRVLTRYAVIDGVDMTKEALRPSRKGERGLVADIIDFAVQVANEHMVPEGMTADVWGRLAGCERFFYKMLDVETTGARKLDNYQNFARAFRVNDYGELMGSVAPNKARLKSAREFKKSGFDGSEFAVSKSRALMFAIWEVEKEVDGDDVISHLRDLVPGYLNVREDLMALADYISRKREGVDDAESRAAGILHGLIRNERL